MVVTKSGDSTASCVLHPACQEWHSFWGQKGKRAQREKTFGSHCSPPTRSCPKHKTAVHYAAMLSLSLGCATAAGLPLLSLSITLYLRAQRLVASQPWAAFLSTHKYNTLLDTDPKLRCSLILWLLTRCCCPEHSAAEHWLLPLCPPNILMPLEHSEYAASCVEPVTLILYCQNVGIHR